MYELLKAKLLILPAWLESALEAHRLRPTDIMTKEGLESILSAPDVEFYQKQVSQLLGGEHGSLISPIQAAFESFHLLHTNSLGLNALGNQASGLNEYVKINA